MTRSVAVARTAAAVRQAIGDAVQQRMAGVWLIKQAATGADMATADVTGGLSGTPGIKGVIGRGKWSDMWQNGGPADPQGILQATHDTAVAAGVPWSFRMMAGTNTPADVLAAVRSFVINPGACSTAGGTAPAPFHADGTPNSELITLAQQSYQWIVNRMLALGGNPAAAHGFWPGDDYAEVNIGADVKALAGWSYANFLAPHQLFVDTFHAIAQAAGLVYSLPLTGCGGVTGATPFSNDIGAYVASKFGNQLGAGYVQANGVGNQSFGYGAWGTTSQATEMAARAGFNANVRHGGQMQFPGDYDWRRVFALAVALRFDYLEVYSNNGAGDGTNPGQGSFSGTRSSVLKAEVLNFNKILAARAAATARSAA